MQKNIVDKLEEFRHKGGAWQSQEKARSLLQELKDLLLDSEWCRLSIAHGHYVLGEGAGELYNVINDLIAHYRSHVQPPKINKTLL